MDMSMDGSPIIDRTPVDGPLSQLRLVLRRLQGDAGLGLVLRAPDRAATSRTRSAPRCRLDRFATGAADRRKGRGRPARTCTEGRPMRIRLPYCGARHRASSPICGDATSRRPDRRAAGRDAGVPRLRLSRATTRAARIASSGITAAAAARWLVRDARHAAPTRSTRA